MLLFILCGVYIWKWVERVREIRVETRRGFRRFVKWNDGRTRYCLYIAGIPISFFFFCCRCDALFIVAMYFFFFLVPLSFAFFLNRNLIFGTCTLFVLFIIGILSSASSCYFRVNIFKSFFYCWSFSYVFSYCIFIAEINFTCLCIPELYFCYCSSPFRKLYSSLVASASVENFSKFQFHHARVPYEGIAERKKLAGLMDYFPHCAGLDTLRASSWNRNWSRMISQKMFIH